MIAQRVAVEREVGEAVKVVGDAVGNRVQKDDVRGVGAAQVDEDRLGVQQDDGGAFGFPQLERDAVEVGRAGSVGQRRRYAQRLGQLGAAGIERFRQIYGCEVRGDRIHGNLRLWRVSRQLKKWSRSSPLAESSRQDAASQRSNQSNASDCISRSNL